MLFSMEARIAEVAVPRPLEKTFDYAIPEPLSEIPCGVRVKVPFGRDVLVGYLLAKKSKSDFAGELQPVVACLDEEPVLSPQALALARWMRDFYLCPMGLVLQAMLPRRLAPARPSRHKVVHLEADLPQTLRALGQLKAVAPQQARLLQALLNDPLPSVGQLLEATGSSIGPLRALAGKGLVSLQPKAPEAIALGFGEGQKSVVLNRDQARAVAAIEAALGDQDSTAFLLQGVNGSGKTEVYLRAVQKALEKGLRSLVLVPEISLTPQLATRFQHRFGASLSILHSGLTDAQQAREWTRLQHGEAHVVLGVRSASLVPIHNLGLMIVDEEHEPTYRQESPEPRYHARDVLLQRRRLDGAVLVLGSATPSLWADRQAQLGTLKRLCLPHRVSDQRPPSVHVVDLNRVRGWFSPPLESALTETLTKGQQCMLLLNRRGFGIGLCKRCNQIQRCPECDISMVFQLRSALLACHYCGRVYEQNLCAQCREPLKLVGLGTQQVEALLKQRYPTARIARMDSDAVRRRQHAGVLEAFRKGKIDVLLGTQMIAMGHDFPNVTLMGIVDADTLLHVPDYAASERTFQLISQAVGRVGRGSQAGTVILQTRNPEHYAIRFAGSQDYAGFVQEELAFREALGYPPFGQLCRLRVSHNVAQKGERIAHSLKSDLEKRGGGETVGPSPMVPFRWRGKYRWQLLLKTDQDSDWRNTLREVLNALEVRKFVTVEVER